MMRKWKLLAASVCAAALAVPASAATFTFNLTGSNISGGYGNQLLASAVADGETLNVRFSAFSAKKAVGGGYSVQEADLDRWAQGLGVSAKSNDGSGSLHTIDNKDSYDFVLMQFDKNVVLDSAKLTPFKIGLSTDNDSTVGFGNSALPWNADYNMTNLSGFVTQNFAGTGSPYVVDFGDLTASAGNLFFIGASWQDFVDISSGTDRKGKDKSFDPDYDGFKLSGLTVSTPPEVPAVPEPASWGMMIAGFGLVGGMARRRKVRTSVSFA